MEHLRDKAENTDDLLERVGETLQERSERRFKTGGEGDWPKLAEGTKKRKERQGLSTQILVATGALRDSYTVKGARGSIFEVQNGRLKYGSSLPYASRHQLGSGVPKRQVIVVDEELELEIVREALESLDFF